MGEPIVLISPSGEQEVVYGEAQANVVRLSWLDEVNLEEMKKDELVELAKDFHLEISPRATKAAIIEALNGIE